MFKYLNDSKRKCILSLGKQKRILAPGEISTFDLDIGSEDVVVFKVSDKGKATVTIESRKTWNVSKEVVECFQRDEQ